MIEFVRINTDYIDALRKIDGRVQSNSAALKKDTKPFLGILFTLKANGIKYYAPISSPKPKHLTMPNGSDFHKILDRDGKLLSVINFNNMVPVRDDLCTKIDFSIDKDRFLLQKEYEFCRDNEEVLKKKAKQLYLRYYKGMLSNREKERTCDFRLLEEELQRYRQNRHVASESATPVQPMAASSAKGKNTEKKTIEIEPLRIIGTTSEGDFQVKIPMQNPEDIRPKVTLPKGDVLLDKERAHVIAITQELQKRYNLKIPGGQPRKRLK